MKTQGHMMADADPLVSVIVPTYNSARKIEHCLQSISAQTYRKKEVIVVDNESSDWTVDRASKYTKNIYVLNGSRSLARAYGVKKSKGKFLLFIDSDQVLSRNLVAHLVQTMEHSRFNALTIPERSAGNSRLSKYYSAERECIEFFNDGIPRFFDRQFYSKIKGYPETIFGEDQWLFEEIKKGTKNLVGVAKQMLYHFDPETLSDLLHKYRNYSVSSRQYFRKMSRMNLKMLGSPLCVILKTRSLKLAIGVAAIKLIKFYGLLF